LNQPSSSLWTVSKMLDEQMLKHGNSLALWGEKIYMTFTGGILRSQKFCAYLSRRSCLGSAPVAPERLTQHMLRHVHARKKMAPALDSGASSARRGGGSLWTPRPRARRPSATLGSGASSARRWGHMVAPTRFGGHLSGASWTRRRLTRGGGAFGASTPCALLVLY
jgi:hypothetical protein